MKQVTKVFLVVLLVLGLAGTVAAAGEVKLLRATSVMMSKYGMHWQSTSFEILVKNLAYEKQVSVWVEGTNGQWYALDASYQRSVGDNQEVWRATGGKGDLRFAIRYQVGGHTYWDNNNGADYFLTANGGALLGNDVNVLTYWQGDLYRTATSMYVAVNVRNLAYDKNVNIVYTTDGWNTTQVQPLSFLRYYGYGYGTFVSPNDYGVEFWVGYVPVPADAQRVEYAVSCDVNGQTCWDSNFGANYVVERRP